MRLVPDTSVIIDGRITFLIRQGDCPDAEVIIPEAVVAGLESQANQGREIGFSGLAGCSDSTAWRRRDSARSGSSARGRRSTRSGSLPAARSTP